MEGLSGPVKDQARERDKSGTRPGMVPIGPGGREDLPALLAKEFG